MYIHTQKNPKVLLKENKNPSTTFKSPFKKGLFLLFLIVCMWGDMIVNAGDPRF